MIDRRRLLQGLGGGAMGLTATGALAQAVAEALTSLPATTGTLFFTADEIAALRAVVDQLIPASEAGPSATEAGVDAYVDGALMAAYGEGAGWYLEGPFAAGERTQGYQLPLTPAELYRRGLAEIDAWAAANHDGPFAQMASEAQVEALTAMQSGEMALASIPAALLFGTIWFDAQVGYFSDPLYGGNRDMAGWRLVGFPGAYSEMREFVGVREPVEIEPVSLKQILEEARR